MTTGEKTKLVMGGCSAALVAQMDGMGWSFAAIQDLLKSGLNFGQI
ncbi:MAG: hypothetical protein FWC61_01270 [Proteobacteria bacterium]|nr:hypothetical protein [Pseudomonadota bacterium]